MRAATFVSVATMAFLRMATAACVPTTDTAIVIVQAYGQDVTNTTIYVPLGSFYHEEALDAVSTLYLDGVEGAASADTVSCTPYRNADGTGNGGLPFDIDTPSRLSTNLVQVGSLFCEAAI